MIRTVAFAIVCTAFLAWLDFLAAFFIYEWAGGDFGGYGAIAHSAAGWALPAWLSLTAASIVLDILAVRAVRRWTSAASLD